MNEYSEEDRQGTLQYERENAKKTERARRRSEWGVI